MENNDQPVFSGIDEALDYMDKPEEETSDSVATIPDEDDEETQKVETEEDETESEDSKDEQPDDEDDSEEDDEDEEKEEDFLFKITDGDEEIVITDVEEAKKGYMRQSQFTKVTQEVSAERKALAADKNAVLELKNEYLKGISDYKVASSEKLSKFVNVDWEVLQKEDPIEFDEMKSSFEAAKMAYEQASQREQEVSSEVTAENNQYAQSVRTEEMGKLTVALPELSEEGSTLLNDATKHAAEAYGFTEDELFTIYDHRQIRALVDAFRFSQSQTKLAAGAAKAKTVKKSIRTKGSVGKTTTQARKAKASKKSLQQPGGVTLQEAMGILHG
jgi:hypothetical protein